MGRNWPYGKAIAGGAPRYFSPSALTLGDSSTEEGCLRKYYYQYVMGFKTPSTAAQEAGTALHAENESYLTTGVNALGSLALRGKHMLPNPGPDLLVEHDIVITPAIELAARQEEAEGRFQEAAELRATATLANAPLRVRGIPVVGYIDLVHGRCENKGVVDIEDTIDPPGTVEVIDWKTTSKIDYIKSPSEMSKTIQMTVYGKWVTTTLPDTTHVRLSHGYYLTKGPVAPRKVTLRVLPEQIERQWERVERVAGSIIEIVREADPDKVPANTRACSAFGGCPYRSQPVGCKAGTQQGLANFFGRTGAENMIKRMNEVTAPAPSNIAARLLSGKNTSAKKVVDDSAALKAESLRLAREEVEAQYPGLPAAWNEIHKLATDYKIGYPQFSGELARAIGTCQGLTPDKGAGMAGCGQLGSFGPFKDPAELPSLLEEMRDMVKQMTDQNDADEIAPLLAPEAPPSDPILASETPEPVTLTAPVSVEVVAAEPGTELVKRRGRPKKVAASTSAVAAQDSTQLEIPVVVETTTLPAGVDADHMQALQQGQSTVQAALVDVKEEPSKNPLDVQETPAPQADKIYFYVDALPSCAYQSFWPLVNKIVGFLNEQAPLVGGTMRDFRLVDNNHGLAYGKWKGAVAACLREITIEPGHWILDGCHGEIAQVVIETMREIVTNRGGVYVRGIK